MALACFHLMQPLLQPQDTRTDHGGQLSAPFLRIEGLSKAFGNAPAVLNQVSLDIQRGEVFALLGPSGCGKSTLLRILAGFETPSSGRVLLNGRDLAGLAPYERPMNMMFQSYALFPHLTVWDNIAFGLLREGLPRAQVRERVEGLIQLVQLEGLSARKPHQLSGGQQQRVALARSLARRPQLLLLDEPLGALDRKLREQTQQELLKVIREVGVSCVMVTHDQDEAMAMATRLAVMNEGRVLQVGTAQEMYETPQSRFVADFIGQVNLMEGRLVCQQTDHWQIDCGDVLHQVEGTHTVRGGAHTGMALTVALRPEKIQVGREEPTGPANRCAAWLQEARYQGSHTTYFLVSAQGRRLQASVSNPPRHAGPVLQPGEPCWAWWSADAQVILDP
jgi:putrescine transport system ATP-binding protein